MAVTGSCWRLIVEYCVIPPGQLKWDLLGYYINPVVLVFCQFFLFGRFVTKLLYYPVIACRYGAVALLRFLTIIARKLVLIMELDDESIARLYGVQEDRRRWFDLVIPTGDEDFDDEGFFHRIVLFECPSHPPPPPRRPPPRRPPSPPSLPPPPPTVRSTDSLLLLEQYEPDEDDDERQDTVLMDDRKETAETDEFYEEYTKNMKVFDHRNDYGISALSFLLNMDMRNLSLLEKMGNEMYTIHNSMIREMTRELFDDLEMIYVGQICLSWDVLGQQYRRVRTFARGDIAGFFYGDVAGEFQKFQVFLERFTESSRLEGTRFLNYIQTRVSNNNLLQVPNVPGFVEDEGDLRNDRVVARITAQDLLNVMKRSMVTFKDFLEEDRSGVRSPGKFRRQLLSVDSPVENPNDLELFVTLSKQVNKKEIELRNLQREKKSRSGSWWRMKKKKKKMGGEEGDEEEDGEKTDELLIFNVIETKLLSRVLKLSNISTKQLRWCQQKLQNLVEVRNGVMVASSPSNGFFSFFPYL